MKKLVWLAALYAPLLFAAPKLSKELSAKFEIANKKVASYLVNDENQKAIEYIKQVLSEIPEGTDEKTLKQDKNYIKLVQSEGDARIADADYKGAEEFYTKLCKDLKPAEKKKCEKPLAVINEIRGTTLDFVVSNPGPLTEVFFINKSERFCFLSDDASLSQKTDNCKIKNKVKAKPNPYKGTIKRAGFADQKFSVPVTVVGTQYKTDSYTLIENPAEISIAPFPKNASISIDGQPSTTSSTLAPGEHTITVSAEGYSEKKEKVLSQAGAIVYQGKSIPMKESITIRLNPYVSFSFDNPKTAELYENDKLISGELKDGRLEIIDGAKRGPFIAKAKGYNPSAPITLPDPVTPGMSIPVSLTASGVFLSLTGAPEGAKLFIDGEPFDLTQKEFTLTAGTTSYQLSVQHPDYLPFEKAVSFKPSTEVDIVIEEMKKAKSPIRAVGFITGGVGVATAGAFGFLALQERTKIEGSGSELGLAEQECVLSNRPDLSELPPNETSSQCTNNTNQKAFFDASRKRQNMARASDLGLGIAVIGGGLVATSFLLKGSSKGAIKEKELALSISPSEIILTAKF